MAALMRVALYARVSTADKEQNPDTQLLPLREFVTAQGWTPAGSMSTTPRRTTSVAGPPGARCWPRRPSASST